MSELIRCERCNIAKQDTDVRFWRMKAIGLYFMCEPCIPLQETQTGTNAFWSTNEGLEFLTPEEQEQMKQPEQFEEINISNFSI
jgi:hypothetical protein